MDNNTAIILDRLEETSEEFWNISRQTGNFISMLIKASSSKNILELGTSNGYSTLWIADALKYTDGHLTTIEFWEKRQCLAREYIANCGLSDYVTFKIGQAYDIILAELQNEQYDLVFIDANKQEYLRFFEAVHPVLKKGGIILADNVLSHAEKVKPFVDAISSHKEYQSQILDLPDGLLMAYKL
jgi:predicted O-methyltransferase YrrM